MANVLFLVHRLPYPLNKGDKLRSYHLLRHLQQQHRVFLATFIDDPADEQFLPELRELCPDLLVVPLQPWRAKLRALLGLFRREPMTLAYYRDRSISDWVASITAAHKIDATLVFCSAMAQYVPLGVRPLVDFVDLDSAKWAQFAPAYQPPLSWIYRREARVLLAHERRVAQSSRAAYFVTQRELTAFEQAVPECRGRAQVLRNGVDAEYFAPTADRRNPFAAGEMPIVFTGSMDYWPNVDAVIWFVREMLPTLKARWPHLRFYIVGRNPAHRVRALASESVVVTGTVADVRHYLQHAAAVVAPMRFARGIQNKILEAMAMAQAVVAMSSCAEVVGASEGQGLSSAVDAKGFVEALSRQLQRTTAEARAIGQAAREFVLSHCRWETNLQPLDQCLALTISEGAVSC